MDKVNSKTGFIRFWVVISVGWIILILAVSLSQDGLSDFIFKMDFQSFMLFVLPPFLLLGIGYFMRWVFRGFRS